MTHLRSVGCCVLASKKMKTIITPRERLCAIAQMAGVMYGVMARNTRKDVQK